MSFEHRSEAGGCDPPPGEPAPGELFGGWEMVQSDWGLRQREPRRRRWIAALRTTLTATAAWLRRLARVITLAGDGSGTRRSSAPRS